MNASPVPGRNGEAGGADRRIVIAGAAGRDFHDFNVVFRADPAVRVVAFTAAQIPGIGGRTYPPTLAGARYPEGIPIRPEAELEAIIRERGVDEVVFAYSDVSHAAVMHLASRALAAGADFRLLGPVATALPAARPVIAVAAVRTGCGKSPISRFIAERVRAAGRRVAVVRHPMPYGDLARQRCQRFATLADLDAAGCTNEEREEYEPHIARGTVVFSGVEMADVLAAAAGECDVILWDGGNNDFPFVRHDLLVVVADALRPDQIATHHPGETCLRMADVIVINKADTVPPATVAAMQAAIRAVNMAAEVVVGTSPVRLAGAERARGRRAMVIEDGPTLTHGGMAYGAGLVAAEAAGVAEVVDPRDSLAAPLRPMFESYPQIGRVLPAVGYDAAQLAAIADTVRASRAEVVISATPLDLAARVDVGRPVLRATYDYADRSAPGLGAWIDRFLKESFG